MKIQELVESEVEPLQLDDKPKLHRQGWIWQSVLWIVLILFIIAGALGAFGDGLLGHQTIGDKDSNLWIEYDKIARRHAPMRIEMHWLAPSNGVSVIVFPSAYLKGLEIQGITPEPVSVSTVNDQIYYRFDGKGAMTVLFHFKPDMFGKQHASVQINNHPFSLRHFIFP